MSDRPSVYKSEPEKHEYQQGQMDAAKAGMEEARRLASKGGGKDERPQPNSPREYLKIKYSAPTDACKCGDCQLVPPHMLEAWAQQIDELSKEL